jgi:hypothetical protein
MFRCATARSSKRAFIVPAADLCRAHVHLVSSCQKIDLNPTSLEKNSVGASPSACLRSQTAKVLQLYIRSQLDDLHVLALCPPSCRLTRGSVRVILRCEEKEMLAAARPQGSKKPENDADARKSFAAVEWHDSDRLPGSRLNRLRILLQEALKDYCAASHGLLHFLTHGK